MTLTEIAFVTVFCLSWFGVFAVTQRAPRRRHAHRSNEAGLFVDDITVNESHGSAHFSHTHHGSHLDIGAHAGGTHGE